MRPTQEVADERKRLVAELHCAGRSQRAIAQMLGVSQPAVSKIISRLGARDEILVSRKMGSPAPPHEEPIQERVLDAARFQFLGSLKGEVRIKRTASGWTVWHDGQNGTTGRGPTLSEAIDQLAEKRYDFVAGPVQFTARVTRIRKADGSVSHIIESAD